MNARDCTRAIGLTLAEHNRAMALVAEVASANGWDEPHYGPPSKQEVGVRPWVGAPAFELYISKTRIMARPGDRPVVACLDGQDS